MNRFFKLFKQTQEDPSMPPKTRKRQGYFLELDEQNPSPVSPAPKAVEAPPVKLVAAPEPKAVAAPPTPTKVTPAKAEPTPPPVIKSEPVAATPAGMTFAPSVLLPLRTEIPRRLPGNNMNSFLEMAKQMQQGKSE
jgi:hypothetical protein